MKTFGLSLAERRYRVKKNPIQSSPSNAAMAAATGNLNLL